MLTSVFSFIVELRVIWDLEKKQQQHLLKQLEETEYAQAQLSKSKCKKGFQMIIYSHW